MVAAKTGRVAVAGLNHVNLLTDDVDGTARFYTNVLELVVRIPVTSLPPGRSRWLCDSFGNAVVHLRHTDTLARPGGTVDHIAFNCVGREELIARLETLGIPFGRYDGLTPGVTQVFITGPDGIKLELVFHDDHA